MTRHVVSVFDSKPLRREGEGRERGSEGVRKRERERETGVPKGQAHAVGQWSRVMNILTKPLH
jgi:hypothetical protein